MSLKHSISHGLTRAARGWSRMTQTPPPQLRCLGDVCWVLHKCNSGNEAFLGVMVSDPACVIGISDGYVFSKYWPVLYRGHNGANPPLFVTFSCGGRVWVYVDTRARCRDPKEMYHDEAVVASLRTQASARQMSGYRCRADSWEHFPGNDDIVSAQRTLQQVTEGIMKKMRASIDAIKADRV